MSIRLATATDIPTLRTLYAERHAERVAEWGAELDIDALRAAWEAGVLHVYVVELSSIIRGALVWARHEGAGWQWITAWWRSAYTGNQIKQRGAEAVRDLASRVPPETPVWGNAPTGTFWAKFFDAAAERMGGWQIRRRIAADGREWATYRTTAGNMAGL